MGKFKCPSCGLELDESYFVGKTKVFRKGKPTTYTVVSCGCGESFRGPVLSSK